MPRSITATTIACLAFWGCEPQAPGPPAVAGVPPPEAARLFLEHCAICHGARGDGFGPRRPSLFNKPPDFREPTWASERSAGNVRALIREGVPGSDMPAWKRLGESAITGLADYVLNLSNDGF
jgi:high-affinity iron transporter